MIAYLNVALTYAAVGAYALEVRAFVLAFVASIALPGLLIGVHRHLDRRRRDGTSGPAGAWL